MSIRIVSHVFARDLPQFGVFLRAQLSSLVLHPPKIPVAITVCLSSDADPMSVQVCHDFSLALHESLDIIDLSLGGLFRRAIGRNLAALSSSEDFVWFTDVDYIFGPGCLDNVYLQAQEFDSGMIWPDSVLIDPDYGSADQFWESNLESKGLIYPDTTRFVKKTYSRAIGGVQIVPGAVARDGYLNNTKWQEPQNPDKPFPCFRDDIAFRRLCTLHQISAPNLIRLRHSKITYKGAANS